MIQKKRLLAFMVIFTITMLDRVKSSFESEVGGLLILGAASVISNVFAGKDKSIPSSTDRYVSKAIELLASDDIDDQKLRQAELYLNASAAKSSPAGLYHLGRIMVGIPDPRLALLSKIILINYDMGELYLNGARKAGLKLGEQLTTLYLGQKMLSQAFELAFKEMPDMQAACHRVRLAAIKKRNPQAAYYLAEAILRPQTATHPWMMSDLMDPVERKKFGIATLEIADQANEPNAQKLMSELEFEDRLYGYICALILRVKDEPISVIQDGKVVSLELGEDGYLEACLDDFFEHKLYKLFYRKPSAETCLMYKNIMQSRVRQLRSFLSNYYQYLGKKYLKPIDTPHGRSSQQTDFIIMMDSMPGQYTLVVPSESDKAEGPEHTYRVREKGVCHPVTKLEVEAAYQLMINGIE